MMRVSRCWVPWQGLPVWVDMASQVLVTRRMRGKCMFRRISVGIGWTGGVCTAARAQCSCGGAP